MRKLEQDCPSTRGTPTTAFAATGGVVETASRRLGPSQNIHCHAMASKRAVEGRYPFVIKHGPVARDGMGIPDSFKPRDATQHQSRVACARQIHFNQTFLLAGTARFLL